MNKLTSGIANSRETFGLRATTFWLNATSPDSMRCLLASSRRCDCTGGRDCKSVSRTITAGRRIERLVIDDAGIRSPGALRSLSCDDGQHLSIMRTLLAPPPPLNPAVAGGVSDASVRSVVGWCPAFSDGTITCTARHTHRASFSRLNTFGQLDDRLPALSASE